LTPVAGLSIEGFPGERPCGMDMEKLEILETKIEEMLVLHNAVCEERDRLSRELEESRTRLRETTEQLQQQEKERAEVRTRVERMLARLNGLSLA
jgi:septal ring factor EnvC (AmiA/AmiB activator)